MANIFDLLQKSTSDFQRNGFDLSQRHIYNSKAGMILPVLSLDCIPGDHHEIDFSSFTRTLPVKTDAFARMTLNYEWLYVPYSQLWQKWDDFILQNSEGFSAAQGSQTIPTETPKFSMSLLLQSIVENYYAYRQDQLNGSNSSTPDLGTEDLNGYEVYDMFGYSRALNALRMLDMLGYGSFYEIRDLMDMATDLSSLAQAQTTLNDSIRQQFGKPANSPTSADSTTVFVNLWRVLSYQKAMNDYFRNNQYTNSNPLLFNLDNYFSTGGLVVNMKNVFNAFSTIWYRQYRKDMFTGLMPSPQFGAVSGVDLSSVRITNPSMPSSSTSVTSSVGGTNAPAGTNRGDLYISGITGTNTWNVSQAFDVYQLRKAEALQKWKEDRLRAGNKNRNIQNVMFGRTSKYLQNKYCAYITGFDGNLSIDEVVNTSAQGDVQLGELGGKSKGICTGRLSFDANEFGTLICVASIQPITEYDAVGLDKNNTLVEPFDYYTPHFENLGFDGVYGYQLSAGIGDANVGSLNRTLGYAPRFLNYKCAVDKVHGEFMSVGFLSGSSVSNFENIGGSLSAWTTPRRDIETLISSGGMSSQFLYIDPAIVDPIFEFAADSSQATDPFIHNVNFNIKSVRQLSVLGLPRW
nr:MAG: major capsid protein [Microviridae sp.]